MPKYLIRRHEAIELFCGLISKSYNIDIERFCQKGSTKLIMKYVDKLKVDAESEGFAKDFFTKKGSKNVKFRGAMLGLSKSIIEGLPTLMSEPKLTFLLSKSVLDKTVSDYLTLENDRLSDRVKEFENTHWFLYYDDQTKSIPIKSGITQAVISFLPFGSVKYARFVISKNGGKILRYSGYYEIQHGDILKVYLKSHNHNLDLNLKIFVGQVDHDQAYGTYDNHYESMLCGAVIISKIYEEDILIQIKKDIEEHTRKDIDDQDKTNYIGDSVKFLTSSNPEYLNINESIRSFFEREKRSLSVPKDINGIS